MSTFHSLKVKAINKETPECVSVSFEVPETEKNEFLFKQGQFLTIRKDINGEEVRRSYSICSCPLDNELTVAIKKVPQGVFSSFALSDLKVGDILEVMPPSGRFGAAAFAESKPKEILAIAAGSGITPIISIIQTVLRSDDTSKVTLLYGNRNRNSIIFKDKLEGLKNKYIDRLSLFHIFSREQSDATILNGRIDGEKVEQFLKTVVDAKSIDEVFLCGPEEMILQGKETLAKAGLAEDHIHFELFTAAGAANKNANVRAEDVSEDEVSKVTVKLDGSAFTMDVPFEGETILDAALRNGADLPFACKGGVCATCRAKLEKGKVNMDVSYGLEKDELEAGFILTCQAHPCDKETVVNFDIK